MKNKETYMCCQCGDDLPLNEFYKSASSIYAALGHLPICKGCLLREYKRYKIDYMSREQAMQRLCMTFDIYYNESLFRTCGSDDTTIVGVYLRKINLGQFKNKTFDNTIRDGFNIPTIEPEVPEDEKPVDRKLIDKWGAGLSPLDYQELEKHHKYLKDANPNCDSNQEIFITELCYTKMQQMKAIRDGDGDMYKKMADSYRETFKQAKLQTSKETNMNDNFSIGVNAEAIEKFTPAEYYKNKKLFDDYDGVGDYYRRMILRPLRNLQFGTKDRDPEFYVKDEDDSDGFSDDE